MEKATLRREIRHETSDLDNKDASSRIGLADLRRVTGESPTSVKSVQAVSDGENDSTAVDVPLKVAGKKAVLHENRPLVTPAASSRWSDRIRTGGYDLMAADSREHRYHVSKTRESGGLTLSAEMTKTTATTSAKQRQQRRQHNAGVSGKKRKRGRGLSIEIALLCELRDVQNCPADLMS